MSFVQEALARLPFVSGRFGVASLSIVRGLVKRIQERFPAFQIVTFLYDINMTEDKDHNETEKPFPTDASTSLQETDEEEPWRYSVDWALNRRYLLWHVDYDWLRPSVHEHYATAPPPECTCSTAPIVMVGAPPLLKPCRSLVSILCYIEWKRETDGFEGKTQKLFTTIRKLPPPK